MSVIIPGNISNENMSRHELLTWVNNLLSANYGKIEEFHSGVAYCQLMHILFPGCILIKNVKINAKLEYECIFNFRLLQKAFGKIDIDKNIPIEKLIKGRFQDNFEFCQWFNRFYYSNCANTAVKLPKIQPQPLKEKNNNEMVNVINRKPNHGAISKAEMNKKPVTNSKAELGGVSKPLNRKSSLTPSEIDSLSKNLNELNIDVDTVKQERNYYCMKLRKIEKLCSASRSIGGEDNIFIDKLRAIIYPNSSHHSFDENYAIEKEANQHKIQ